MERKINMSNILIYGSRQFAHYVRELALECGHIFIGFIDDFYKSEDVLGTFDEIKEMYRPEEYKIVIAIGYNNLESRWDIYNKVASNGYEIVSLIHPKAYVHTTSEIGNGTIISVGAIIDYNTQIGNATFIWPGVIVNHDSKIGSNCFLSPQVNVCGFVNVGNNCFLGASSVIINGNNINDNTFIKAGTVYYRKESSK